MKKKHLLAFFFLILGACAAISYFNHPDKKHIVLFADAGESAGGDNDAEARYKWEMSRLIDPATGKVPFHIRANELDFASWLPKIDQATADNRGITSLAFSSRGPWNLGGRTRALAVDIMNDNIVLAGSVNGGLWRSADGGTTWARVSPLNENPSVSYIVQDKRAGHTNVWYYGSGEATSASASGHGGAYYLGNGIYKSTDNGITWAVLTSTHSLTPQLFDSYDLSWRMAVDLSDTAREVVYTASLAGIYKSINGGTSWSLDKGTAFVAGSSYYTDVDVTSTGIVYATLSSDGVQRGVWRKGTTYANITPPSWSTATYDRIVIGINPSNENEVYFLGVTDSIIGKVTTNYRGDRESNGLWKYTYISGNGTGAGGVWENLSANIPNDGSEMGNFNSQGGYDLLVKVHPDSSNIVYIGGTNLFRSKDGFSTTNNTTTIGGYNPGSTIPFYTNYPNHHSDQHNLAFLPSNHDIMLSSMDGGVTKTLNCRADTVVWQTLNNGYLTGQFYTVAVDHGAVPNDIIIGGTQDNGTWFTNNTNLTTPWTWPGQGDGSFCAIDNGHANYYTSRQEGRIARATLDANGNVTAFRRIDPIGGSNYLFIAPFILDPNNNDIMYLAAGNRVWRNDSLTQIPLTGQWDSISQGWFQIPDTIPVAGLSVTALAASKTPANRLYYGTSNKRIYRVNNSNTMSPVTSDITPTIFPNGGYINCVAVDPNDGDKIMVVFSNYAIYSLFYSSNGGSTWVKCAGNLEQFVSGGGTGPSVRWASIIPVAGGTVYLAGTSVGLYATSTLNGASTVWSLLSPNEIGNMVVDMMDFRTADGMVAIGTHGAGVFSTFVTDTIATNLAEINPLSLNISTYPNPASDMVKIKFHSNDQQSISLAVYDANGNAVETILKEELLQGNHEYVMHRKNLAAGIYFVQLKANGKSFVKKIVFAD